MALASQVSKDRRRVVRAVEDANAFAAGLYRLEAASHRIKEWSVAPNGQHLKTELPSLPVDYAVLEGASVIFDAVQAEPFEALLDFYHPLHLEIESRQANCVVSGRNYQCAIHFDPQYIVSVQLSGRKFWSLKQGLWQRIPEYGWLDSAAREQVSTCASQVPLRPPELEKRLSRMEEVAPSGIKIVDPGTWHFCATLEPATSVTLSYVIRR